MKSLNAKLALAAVGIALVASPAFAQKPAHHARQQAVQSQVPPAPDYTPATGYPNGAVRSGSADSVESGAEFND